MYKGKQEAALQLVVPSPATFFGGLFRTLVSTQFSDVFVQAKVELASPDQNFSKEMHMSAEGLTPKQVLREISNGHIRARATYAAATLGVADHVGTTPVSIADLAEKTQSNEVALYRLMRFLSGLGIFQENTDRKFSHTPISEFLKSDHEHSERGAVLMRGEMFYSAFEEILHSVRTSEEGFSKRFKKPLFEYLQEDEAAFKSFQAGMRSLTGFEANAVLKAYEFSDIKKVIDVGGGNGTNLSEILRACPNVSGTLFDLESSIQMARDGAGGPLPRCELVVGDFFDEVVEGGDLYILKNILHDWYDEQAIKILENCRRAMKPESRLIIVERLIGAPNYHNNTSNQDLTMLVAVGGLERRAEEFVSLVKKAGLNLDRTIETEADVVIMECSPR